MTREDLRHFLLEKMSMTEIYQPVIIRELLKNGGSCSKDHLASKLAEYDLAVLQYFRQILMRWPKKTLNNTESSVMIEKTCYMCCSVI